MQKKVLQAAVPLLICIPYAYWVLKDRFASDLKRRDEILAENAEKNKIIKEGVNSKYN